MTGVDTNVLVRYITADDSVQTPIAKALIEGAEDEAEREPLYVNTIVLCELCWTLRGRPYAFDRPSIAAVIEKMLATQVFELQNRDLVQRAAEAYRLGRADFADYLIGLQNQRAGCEDTATFDTNLKAFPGFRVL